MLAIRPSANVILTSRAQPRDNKASSKNIPATLHASEVSETLDRFVANMYRQMGNLPSTLNASDGPRGFMASVDHIWHGCRLATLSPSRQGLGLVDDGLIAAADGRIVYAGPAADAPRSLDAKQRTNCDGR